LYGAAQRSHSQQEDLIMFLFDWLSTLPILVVGGIVAALMTIAVIVGSTLRARQDRGLETPREADGGEGYLVSAVLGLLALLMGFTFSLAIDRFEARRVLVLEEANAIGTAYLRAQLLEQPHRKRVGDILVAYTDNRLDLATAAPDRVPALLQRNDAMITDLWAATSVAFVTIKGMDFSSTFVDSINTVIDLDAARKMARAARVPSTVFAVLVVYLVVTSAVLGYVLVGQRRRLAAGFTLALLATSFLLILDIDRPRLGGVQESQAAMEALRDSLKAQSPAVYDRYLGPTAPTPSAP
jgi:hypothetical protein